MTSTLINPKYTFPEYHSWPFFFTIQKHSETKRKQLRMWIDLIVKFCKDNKVWRLSKSDFLENIGKNRKINRQLNQEAISIIFQALVQDKRAMYVSDNNSNELFILWKTIQEWEKYIYDIGRAKGTDNPETLDGLSTDDEVKYDEHYMIDRDLLIIILKNLEKQGKCGLLTSKTENCYIGVKFNK